VAGPGEKPILDTKLPFDTPSSTTPMLLSPLWKGAERFVASVMSSILAVSRFRVRGAVDPHISGAKE
jgi:hypothetical protein